MMTDNYLLISELTKLKQVFRTTQTQEDRKESTAEHSWSASMIVMILMHDLKQEFGAIDELKAIKLTLIHDIVEIYAGDVLAFDEQARKNILALEWEALHKLVALSPGFGPQLQALWTEFEEKQTLEAKIAKAADAICPIFQRVQTKQSYIPFGITLEKLNQSKTWTFGFSKTFQALYLKLQNDLLMEKLILDI